MSNYFQHEDTWTWDLEDTSHVTLVDERTRRTVTFHPKWSKGTAGIRGTRQLNNGRYYWELETSRRTSGTSVQFGVGTKKARTKHENFVDLMGNDENSWALSHRGLIFHGGVAYQYTDALLDIGRHVRIAVEFDGVAGTLAFYKDGVYLGIAFRGLQHMKEPLYPMVSSTALKTKMRVQCTRQDFVGLKDMCRSTIINNMTKPMIDRILLPENIRKYIEEVMERVSITPCHRSKHYTINFE